jgi:peptidoglycan hydrolase CwlO-like protein
MKKSLLILLVLLMAAVASQAWARGPYRSAAANSQVTQEQRQQFLQDTEALRKEMWGKQAELRELLAKPESDPTTIGTLQKEIVQLRGEIREKAQQAGMPCPMGGGGMGMGRGPGGGGGGRWAGQCPWR